MGRAIELALLYSDNSTDQVINYLAATNIFYDKHRFAVSRILWEGLSVRTCFVCFYVIQVAFCFMR